METTDIDLADVDRIYLKLAAIPDDKWCAYTFDNEAGQGCVFGQLGVAERRYFGRPVDVKGNPIEDAEILEAFLKGHTGLDPAWINNDKVAARSGKEYFNQSTPKERIMAAFEFSYELIRRPLPT